MTDPRIISIVSTIFAVMGSYSLYTGSRRIRDARRAGHPTRWYKQISFLTGIEYILLTFVFLLGLANRQGQFSPDVKNFTVTLYVILLVGAAIIAGLVIHRGILDMRASRTRRLQVMQTVQAPIQPVVEGPTKEELEAQARRQRERRKNAAAARRRRAGKA
jgi:hypothetical protein